MIVRVLILLFALCAAAAPAVTPEAAWAAGVRMDDNGAP